MGWMFKNIKGQVFVATIFQQASAEIYHRCGEICIFGGLRFFVFHD
jgi:hypothetical protein